MRTAIVIACLFAAGCATQTAGVQTQSVSGDDFVISGDACGASRYAHLVGREFAEIYRAAMPADMEVIGHAMRRTLEYTPERLNVVVDGQNRIVAIGCF